MPTTRRQLDTIAATKEREMLRAFAAILDDIRDGVTLTELVKHLEMGRVDLVVEALQLDRATWQPLEEAIRDSYKAGGMTAAAQLGQITTTTGVLVARFDIRAPTAERWLQQKSSGLIVEIIEQQRELVRSTLTRNLAEGVNPRQAALDLVGRVGQSGRREGGFIGLTDNQAGWVANARQELESLDERYFTRALRDKRFDPAIKRAIRDGKPLDTKTIDSAVTKMQARAERYRGEVIARTESIDALRAGQKEMIDQAVERAEVETGDMVKTWSATGGERTRDDHADADGQTVPYSQPFTVGGEMLLYPGDRSLGASAGNTIQCRCSARYEIRFGAQLKRLEGFR